MSNSLINRLIKPSVKISNLDIFKGKTVLVDSYNFFYKYLYGNKYNDPTYHMKITEKIINDFTKHDITPIFIFDGPTPEYKKQVVCKRKERRTNAQIICATTQNETEYQKYHKKTISLTKTMITDIISIFDKRNVKYKIAKTETDIYCAKIINKNIFGVITDDIDIILFGSHTIFKRFSFKYNYVETININCILNQLNIFSQDNFIMFSCLLKFINNRYQIKKYVNENDFNETDNVIDYLKNKMINSNFDVKLFINDIGTAKINYLFNVIKLKN